MATPTIRFICDQPPAVATLDTLFGFLRLSRIAPDGALCLLGSNLPESPTHADGFEMIPDDGREVSLEIAFLDEHLQHTHSLLKNRRVAKLLVGQRGLPSKPGHVSVPFERTRFAARWLRPVLEQAATFGWHVHLLHYDHTLVSREIMKLADWFHLDAVKQALEDWVTQDVATALADLIKDYAHVEVRAAVGKAQKLLEREGDEPIFLLGSLSSGYHLAHKHHGLNYGKLLTVTGGSGYFLAE